MLHSSGDEVGCPEIVYVQAIVPEYVQAKLHRAIMIFINFVQSRQPVSWK